MSSRRCILGCPPGPGPLYVFPPAVHPKRRALWLKQLGIKYLSNRYCYVCYRHFSSRMISGRRVNYNGYPDQNLTSYDPSVPYDNIPKGLNPEFTSDEHDDVEIGNGVGGAQKMSAFKSKKVEGPKCLMNCGNASGFLRLPSMETDMEQRKKWLYLLVKDPSCHTSNDLFVCVRHFDEEMLRADKDPRDVYPNKRLPRPLQAPIPKELEAHTKCIQNCTYYKRKYSFPQRESDAIRRRIWLEQFRRNKDFHKEGLYACDGHFSKSMCIDHYLRPLAVPNKNLPITESLFKVNLCQEKGKFLSTKKGMVRKSEEQPTAPPSPPPSEMSNELDDEDLPFNNFSLTPPTRQQAKNCNKKTNILGRLNMTPVPPTMLDDSDSSPAACEIKVRTLGVFLPIRTGYMQTMVEKVDPLTGTPTDCIEQIEPKLGLDVYNINKEEYEDDDDEEDEEEDDEEANDECDEEREKEEQEGESDEEQEEEEEEEQVADVYDNIDEEEDNYFEVVDDKEQDTESFYNITDEQEEDYYESESITPLAYNEEIHYEQADAHANDEEGGKIMVYDECDEELEEQQEEEEQTADSDYDMINEQTQNHLEGVDEREKKNENQGVKIVYVISDDEGEDYYESQIRTPLTYDDGMRYEKYDNTRNAVKRKANYDVSNADKTKRLKYLQMHGESEGEEEKERQENEKVIQAIENKEDLIDSGKADSSMKKVTTTIPAIVGKLRQKGIPTTKSAKEIAQLSPPQPVDKSNKVWMSVLTADEPLKTASSANIAHKIPAYVIHKPNTSVVTETPANTASKLMVKTLVKHKTNKNDMRTATISAKTTASPALKSNTPTPTVALPNRGKVNLPQNVKTLIKPCRVLVKRTPVTTATKLSWKNYQKFKVNKNYTHTATISAKPTAWPALKSKTSTPAFALPIRVNINSPQKVKTLIKPCRVRIKKTPATTATKLGAKAVEKLKTNTNNVRTATISAKTTVLPAVNSKTTTPAVALPNRRNVNSPRNMRIPGKSRHDGKSAGINDLINFAKRGTTWREVLNKITEPKHSTTPPGIDRLKEAVLKGTSWQQVRDLARKQQRNAGKRLTNANVVNKKDEAKLKVECNQKKPTSTTTTTKLASQEVNKTMYSALKSGKNIKKVNGEVIVVVNKNLSAEPKVREEQSQPPLIWAQTKETVKLKQKSNNENDKCAEGKVSKSMVNFDLAGTTSTLLSKNTNARAFEILAGNEKVITRKDTTTTPKTATTNMKLTIANITGATTTSPKPKQSTTIIPTQLKLPAKSPLQLACILKCRKIQKLFSLPDPVLDSGRRRHFWLLQLGLDVASNWHAQVYICERHFAANMFTKEGKLTEYAYPSKKQTESKALKAPTQNTPHHDTTRTTISTQMCELQSHDALSASCAELLEVAQSVDNEIKRLKILIRLKQDAARLIADLTGDGNDDADYSHEVIDLT